MHITRFILLLALSWSVAIPVSAAALKAGVAKRDITPPVGYRMAGYFNERLSTGTHDPLWVKAIVLDDGKQKLGMAFCDLVGISLNISTNVRAQVSAKTGIPVQNIFISSTHSHTGPLFEGVIRDYLHDVAIARDGKDPREEIDYPAFLIAQASAALIEANKNLKPATAEVGIGKREGISFNRRYLMKNGRVAFNPGVLNTNIVQPAGPIDPDVGILFLRDASKKPMGGLTVFAVHADCIGGTDYSADYAYFLEQTLQREFGKNYVSAFAAGTCGDINQINVKTNEPVKGLPVSEKIGTNLAQTVIEELPKLKTLAKPAFATRSERILAPLKDVTPAQLADAKEKIKKIDDDSTGFFIKVDAVRDIDIAGKGSTWPLEIQVFRLDSETAIVGLPCEVFVELGLAIKKQSPFKRTFVISIANDRPSYVPTKKAFTEGSYEITNARVKAGTGEMMVETAVNLLKSVAP